MSPPSADDRAARVEHGPPSGLRARRVAAGVLLGGVVAAGLLVHGVLPDTPVSDIVGDALYGLAAYLLVALLAPRLPAPAVGAIAATWCVAVELFQLSGLPLAWGARFPPVMLALGTVFDARDLVVYLVAIAVATGVDAGIGAMRRR